MRNRRTQIGAQFSARIVEMQESPAYRVLSLSARRVMDRIEIEFAHHGGTDNGRLPVTYSDFHAYGIDYQAIAPAIRELVALGFVEVTEPGSAGNAEFRKPSLYRITYRHTNKAGPTHDWRQIKTDDDAKATASAARKASKMQKSSGEKSYVSVGEISSDNRQVPDGKLHPTASGGKTPTTSISRGGDSDAA